MVMAKQLNMVAPVKGVTNNECIRIAPMHYPKAKVDLKAWERAQKTRNYCKSHFRRHLRRHSLCINTDL